MRESPFRGIKLVFPTAHTDRSTPVRYLKTTSPSASNMLNTPREVAILRDTKHRTKRRDRESDAPDMRVVGIDFNPGPDAEERLRRLFTILVRLADDELPSPNADSPDRSDAAME